jgi:hypothetical protein
LAQARSEIAALHASLRDSVGRLRSDAESDRARASELGARVAAAEVSFDSRLAELRRALDAGVEQLRAEQHALDAGLRAEQRSLVEGLRAERGAHIRAREEEFQSEMRERIEHLLEEQRVCFKQLSLEAGESAAAQDHARSRRRENQHGWTGLTG